VVVAVVHRRNGGGGEPERLVLSVVWVVGLGGSSDPQHVVADGDEPAGRDPGVEQGRGSAGLAHL
jgi:hypothetical protein